MRPLSESGRTVSRDETSDIGVLIRDIGAPWYRDQYRRTRAPDGIIPISGCLTSGIKLRYRRKTRHRELRYRVKLRYRRCQESSCVAAGSRLPGRAGPGLGRPQWRLPSESALVPGRGSESGPSAAAARAELEPRLMTRIGPLPTRPSGGASVLRPGRGMTRISSESRRVRVTAQARRDSDVTPDSEALARRT
jgi:hypothetical protein